MQSRSYTFTESPHQPPQKKKETPDWKTYQPYLSLGWEAPNHTPKLIRPQMKVKTDYHPMSSYTKDRPTQKIVLHQGSSYTKDVPFLAYMSRTGETLRLSLLRRG